MESLASPQSLNFSIPHDQTGSDNILFTFTRDSVWNTIITGPDIIYQVSTPKGILTSDTSITRIDRHTEEKRSAGQIVWKLSGRTMVRVGRAGIEWMRVSEWLTNDKSSWSSAKSFTGAYGVRYRWKMRKNRWNLTTDEDPTNPDDSQPSLACFHTSRHNLKLKQTRPAYLEVSPKVLHSIDHILVSLLIMEKRRRDD